MPRPLVAFTSLYAATLLMLLGLGLLNSYLALRLSAANAADFWVGALMAANYFGLVVGGKFGHRLIARVGHVRAYVACGGVVSAAVLVHGLVDQLAIWLALRVLVGVCIMCQYMVIESWLNEQADHQHRGMVFSGYMIAVYMGLVLGQLALGLENDLGLAVLLWIAMSFSLALVPVAVTRQMHPEPLVPAPMDPMFFMKRIPQSLIATGISGLIVGAYYGLGPVFASARGLDTASVGQFMGAGVLAGLVIQWPLGKLSDRFDRSTLIRINAALLALVCLPVLILPDVSEGVLMGQAFLLGLLQFTLYPLAVAFANDHVPAERRVSLTAMLLVTFSVGACVGPLIAGGLMTWLGAQQLYVYTLVCAVVLALAVRPKAVTNQYQAEEAPIHHQPVPPILGSSPLVAVLDPRIEEGSLEVAEDPMDGQAEKSPVK